MDHGSPRPKRVSTKEEWRHWWIGQSTHGSQRDACFLVWRGYTSSTDCARFSVLIQYEVAAISLYGRPPMDTLILDFQSAPARVPSGGKTDSCQWAFGGLFDHNGVQRRKDVSPHLFTAHDQFLGIPAQSRPYREI
ncbi:hypothetical protein RvY_09744-1 [Ramazzottius varieornatus]|uniref:Uncharacterized protein n=1 Tax=Ramazzottius varieornatus TaxID=947166 RepID=A0A1D1VEW0_RAMVA|nr:hypothetical protein RvY_09744-1 [Ramazzottius varieornatus]